MQNKVLNSYNRQQNGQVISGECSVLAGNSALCQDQDNSNELSFLNDPCELPFTVGAGTPNELSLTMFADNFQGCGPTYGDYLAFIRIPSRIFTSEILSDTKVIVEDISSLPPNFSLVFSNQSDCTRGNIVVTVRKSSGLVINWTPVFGADCTVRMPESSTLAVEKVVLDVKFTR